MIYSRDLLYINNPVPVISKINTLFKSKTAENHTLFQSEIAENRTLFQSEIAENHTLFQNKIAENHTLLGGTYPYSEYRVVVLELTHLKATRSTT